MARSDQKQDWSVRWFPWKAGMRAAAVIFLSAFPNPVGAEGLIAEVKREDIVTITIVNSARDKCDKAFDPPSVTISVGTTVVWINQDSATHTIISAEGEDPCNLKAFPPLARAIDASIFFTMSYRKTFDKPGVYFYTCHLPFHQMSGKIIVEPKHQ